MTATITTLPTWPEDVPVHPAAELFPLMGGAEFSALVEDIRNNGLFTPIVRTPDGQILDGRNRYRACLLAEVEPTFETHDGEPWRFVVSTNLHRRHLTDAQRAMVAGKIAERAQGSNRFRTQTQIDPPIGGSIDSPPTHAEAAELLNVSHRQVERARAIVKNGTEKLVSAVESGAVSVSTAERMAALPAEHQDEFANRALEGGRTQKKRAAVSAPTKPAPPPEDDLGWIPPRGDSSPRASARRRELIAELAERGWSSRQIEQRIDMLAVTIRKIARDSGITIGADAAVGRSHKHDSDRIVRETVHTLEGLTMGLTLVNVSDLDRSEIKGWSKSLDESIRAVNRLIKQMKELDQ